MMIAGSHYIMKYIKTPAGPLRLCGLLLLLSTVLSAQAKESVAVLDLEGRGISAMEAATLTDRMRSELVKTGAVTVVERGQMQEILSEQDFQLTGCTSDECAVQIGELLGVTTMFAGSIGKIGNTYTIDVRTIDVQRGSIINTMTRDYRGEIDGLLREIERMAWSMVGVVHPDEMIEDLQPGVLDLDEIARQQEDQPEARPKKKIGKRLFWAAVIVVGGGGGGYVAYTTLFGPEPEDPIGNPPGFPQVQ